MSATSFPFHNRQETPYVQQVPSEDCTCECGGRIEVMNPAVDIPHVDFFLHHANGCETVRRWIQRKPKAR